MFNWAKKVPQELISRLYNQSISGIYDEELADEAGWALYARCDSIITVTNAFENKCITCPNCGTQVFRIDQNINCTCGKFNIAWKDFQASYKNKQLYAANALPIFINFCNDFPKSRSYGEKLICIDVLIHSFHIRYGEDKNLDNHDATNQNLAVNRPTGANLIEGTLSEVILFLDKLSAIDNFSQQKQRWQSIIKRANGGEILK